MNTNLLMSIIFFKIGALSFGGGTAMIPAIYQNLQSYGLINYDEFANIIVVSQVTPGMIALNLATYIGLEKGGFLTAALATLAATIPSVIVMFLGMKLWNKMKENDYTKSFLEGVKASSLGLILSAVFIMAKGVEFGYVTIFIVCLAFVGSVIFKKNPMLILFISGVIGGIFLV